MMIFLFIIIWEDGVFKKKRKKMNIDLYTLCWNEIKIIPFVIQYWENIKNQVDLFHAYVYDNGSNDGSIEELSKYDWITVRHFDSDGINELAYLQIKNNAWKESRGKADFVIVCDMDECLYTKDFKKLFEDMKKENISLCTPKWLEMYSKEFPIYNGKLLHMQITKCKGTNADVGTSKTIIFNPNKIKEINYVVGAHQCNPIGEIKMLNSNNTFIMHYKHLSIDYVLNRYKKCAERLSLINKRMGWGYHYALSEDENRKNFDKEYNECINVNDILNEEN